MLPEFAFIALLTAVPVLTAPASANTFNVDEWWDGILKEVDAATIKYPDGALHKDEGDKLIAEITTDGPKDWLKILTTTFNARTWRPNGSAVGKNASDWLFGVTKQLASSNPAIEVTQFEKHSPQRSIIVKLPGNSSTLVAVGAHFDTNWSWWQGAMPGADDNGSGVVVLLEVLRVLTAAGFKPSNTIEFHFYGGGEAGLFGSSRIWESYKAAGKTVIGYLNQDMAGYSRSGIPAVFEDSTDPSLTKYLTALIKAYLNITPNTSRCDRYRCSDHVSAHENGFPAVYVAEDIKENLNPYIDTAFDTYDKIMWDIVLNHCKIVLAYLLEASYI